jgi:hypothetical protein
MLQSALASAATLACALTLSTTASADLLTNGNFDASGGTFFQGSGDPATTNAALPNWTYSTTNGFIGVSDGNGFAPAGGDVYNLYFNGPGFVETADDSYAVVDAGSEYELSLRGLNETAGVPGFNAAIRFYDAGGNLLGDGGSAADLLVGEPQFSPQTVSTTGTAPVGSAFAGVRLTQLAPNGEVVLYDNVQLTLVPEPGSLALLGLGGALGLVRRRSPRA